MTKLSNVKVRKLNLEKDHACELGFYIRAEIQVHTIHFEDGRTVKHYEPKVVLDQLDGVELRVSERQLRQLVLDLEEVMEKAVLASKAAPLLE